jgi:hypothetical protein
MPPNKASIRTCQEPLVVDGLGRARENVRSQAEGDQCWDQNTEHWQNSTSNPIAPPASLAYHPWRAWLRREKGCACSLAPRERGPGRLFLFGSFSWGRCAHR